MASLIVDMFKRERERLKIVIPLLREEAREDVKGWIRIIEMDGRQYAYHCYRENGKIRSKYLGPADEYRVQKMKDKIRGARMIKEWIAEQKRQIEDIDIAVRVIERREAKRWPKKK